MVDLVLRPSVEKGKWALQLRWHDSLGPIEYLTLARVPEEIAREIIRAGAADWMFVLQGESTVAPRTTRRAGCASGSPKAARKAPPRPVRKGR